MTSKKVNALGLFIRFFIVFILLISIATAVLSMLKDGNLDNFKASFGADNIASTWGVRFLLALVYAGSMTFFTKRRLKK